MIDKQSLERIKACEAAIFDLIHIIGHISSSESFHRELSKTHENLTNAIKGAPIDKPT